MDGIRERILGTVEDMVANLLYYDRKEDEDLPVGAAGWAVSGGVVGVPGSVSGGKEVAEMSGREALEAFAAEIDRWADGEAVLLIAGVLREAAGLAREWASGGGNATDGD